MGSSRMVNHHLEQPAWLLGMLPWSELVKSFLIEAAAAEQL